MTVNGATNNNGAGWSFNGDVNNPTFDPSLLITWNQGVRKKNAPENSYEDKDYDQIPHRCHSYIRNGKIEFLSDCTHELAGKTIELPDNTTS